ncbi:MAG: ABC transporter ATP-binding protein [Pirellula sp.]
MKNFAKAIKESIHLAPAIILATLCSLGIACLWGGNITALYPVIEVTLKNESIQDWLQKQSDTLASQKADIENKLANAPPAEQPTLQGQLRDVENSLGWNERKLDWAEALLPTDPFFTICVIMGVLVFSTLIKHMLMLTSDLLIGFASSTLVRNLRSRLFSQALHMDRSQFQQVGNSTFLAALTTGTDGLAMGLVALFGVAIREPMRVLSCLILACFISWRLLFLSIVLAPALVAIIIFFNKKIRSVAASILGRNAGFHEIILESLNNIFTVQAYTMEPKEKEKFTDCTKQMQRLSLKMIFYNGLSKPFTELVGIGMVAITVCAGSYLVVNQQTHILGLKIRDTPLSVTDLLIFFGLLIGASDPLRKLSGISILIYSGATAANLIYSILDTKPTITDPSEPIPLTGSKHDLSLNNVSFHYHASHPILRDVNLDIPFGKVVAILGHNGSGKSTLIQLISRYYDPTAGSLSLGGVDIRNLSLHDLRSRIALVSQSTELFNQSVLANIQYGQENCSIDEVLEAAKQAHAHEFITDALSGGYETVVGQSGQRLSGGQRQRIALARAILRTPEIRILDESTSQIDMASEIQIRETLEAMKGRMTIIIITHREALLKVADEVYTIEKGILSKSQIDYSKSGSVAA